LETGINSRQTERETRERERETREREREREKVRERERDKRRLNSFLTNSDSVFYQRFEMKKNCIIFLKLCSGSEAP
jgi:hypothetical protein